MRLFVYGELTKPAVLQAVLGRVPSVEPALLYGYRRLRDDRIGYYRAVPRAESMIAGLLLGGLDDDELEAIDAFENVEGGEYSRTEVEVETLAPRRRRSAWVYV